MTPLFQLTEARRGIIFSWLVPALLLAAIFLVSCSNLKNENSTAGGGGHTTSAADNSNPAAASPAAAGEGKPTTWEANATSLNAKDGETVTLACSPGGTAHAVWGSDIYTADSSICTAAVHSGLITYPQGGTVTIELRPGRDIYGCSERNGVTTSFYGPYAHSFVFKTANIEDLVREADEQTPVLWNSSAAMLGPEIGKTHKFQCPPAGRESAVWGSDLYTSDSSICNAAVHAGKFTSASGGSVTIELRPGASAYKGTTRNGITTRDYGPYGRSFGVK